jgi:hypothetical protein
MNLRHHSSHIIHDGRLRVDESFQFRFVRHTEYGNDLLNNFVRRVCECKGQWTMENFIEIMLVDPQLLYAIVQQQQMNLRHHSSHIIHDGRLRVIKQLRTSCL